MKPWEMMQRFGQPDSSGATPSPLLFAAFSAVSTAAYVDIQPSALIYNDETFTADTEQFTLLSEATPGTFTVSGGVATVSHGSGAKNNIIVTGADIGQPQFCAAIDVVTRSGSATGYDNIGVGVCKDANNFIFASFDRYNVTARIQVKIGGVNNFYANRTIGFNVPYKIALSIVGNTAVMWADTGAGWEYITSYNFQSNINFKTTSLAGWRPAFTVASPGDATWVFDNFKAGRFGAVGMRDHTIVTSEDGAPYIDSGKVYFTATAAYPVGGVETSYLGVFTANLSSYEIQQTGLIQVNRGSTIHNDHAAHIVRNSNTDMRLLVSTWGNGFGGSLQILHKQFSSNLLSGASVVSGMTQLSLTGVGCYDPMLVKIGSTWNLAYSITDNTSFTGNPFYAALATSSDLVSWGLVASDSANKGYEGAKIIKDEGGYKIAVGGPAGSGNSSRVYDMGLSYLGPLSAVFSGGSDTQPHPMAFSYGSDWYMLTFNSNRYTPTNAVFSWGNTVIHKG